jgi:electron transport complex protein RnfC
MTIKSFKGGVHLPERKDLTAGKPVTHLFPLTKTVCIPVSQGGAPNRVLVKVGDKIIRGQKIAENEAFMAVPVHASISGTVKKLEPHLVTGNTEALCVIIEADDSGTVDYMPVLDPFTCTRDAALARIRAAGLVGMGGAAFPTHVKLNPPKGAKIDYFIANAAECEPYLTTDESVIRDHAAKVVDGIAIAMYITGAAEGFIALEQNKADLAPILEKALADQKSVPVGAGACQISIVFCKTKYPQGGEKMLIKAVTGREVPSGGLPAHAGCVVQNVGTLRAISEAFREGKPLIDRVLTISGGACANPANIEVPIGTLVGDLIPESIQLRPGVAKIIAGGPMMGMAMKSANFPVQKNTSGVLFLTAAETALVEESPCIGCGRCIKQCSCRLAPVLIIRAINAGDLDEAKRCGLMDCVECGTCAYICPAHVKLVQRFKVGKLMVRTEAAKETARAAAKESAKGAS